MMVGSLQQAHRHVLGKMYATGDNPKSLGYSFVAQYVYDGSGLRFVSESRGRLRDYETNFVPSSDGHEVGGNPISQVGFPLFVPLSDYPVDIKQAT